MGAHLPETVVDAAPLARVLGVAATPGLSEIISGRVELAEAAQRASRLPYLRVITTGGAATAAGLMQSHALRQTRQRRCGSRPSTWSSRRRPPPPARTPRAWPASPTRAILTVELRRTGRPQVIDAAEQLRRVGTPLLGAVVMPRVLATPDGRPVAALPPAGPRSRSDRTGSASGAGATRSRLRRRRPAPGREPRRPQGRRPTGHGPGPWRPAPGPSGRRAGRSTPPPGCPARPTRSPPRPPLPPTPPRRCPGSPPGTPAWTRPPCCAGSTHCRQPNGAGDHAPMDAVDPAHRAARVPAPSRTIERTEWSTGPGDDPGRRAPRPRWHRRRPGRLLPGPAGPPPPGQAGTAPGAADRREPETPGPAARRLPAWPVVALLLLYPLWWALGLGRADLPAARRTDAAAPARAHSGGRAVRLPPGFGLWLDLPGRDPGRPRICSTSTRSAPSAARRSSRLVGAMFRIGQYASLTVLLLYAGNLTDAELPRRRLVRLLGLAVRGDRRRWAARGVRRPVRVHLAGGVAAAGQACARTASCSRWCTRTRPRSWISSAPGRRPRPAAPWGYTNTWGNNFCLLIVWFVVAAWGRATRPGRGCSPWPAWAVAVLPVVHSLNRGLWIGLGVAAGYVALRLALGGRLWAIGAVADRGRGTCRRAGRHPARRGRGSTGWTTASPTACASTSPSRPLSGLAESPVIGFGSTRTTLGGRNSIAVGESPSLRPLRQLHHRRQRPALAVALRARPGRDGGLPRLLRLRAVAFPP